MMKILFINSLSADYVQDLTYSGLVKVFGKENIIDYPWNKKYHLPYKKYPKNLGYTSGSLFSSLLNRSFKNIDLVIVGSAKVDCFESYLSILESIPTNVNTVFVDGGDQSEIARDLVIYGRPELYGKVIEKREFDYIFKREYLLESNHPSNVHPFPISFNMDRLPSIPQEYKYDVSFWAVESDPIRVDALNLLQNEFDCAENGTVRSQKFSRYKRKGDFYLQELAACKVVLNFRGGGWDTMRYWEVPAVGAFMMSQNPGILIPNNFIHEKEVIFIKDDLSDLIDLAEYYRKHDDVREKIAQNGHQKLLAYHTDVKRIEYMFDIVNK